MNPHVINWKWRGNVSLQWGAGLKSSSSVPPARPYLLSFWRYQTNVTKLYLQGTVRKKPTIWERGRKSTARLRNSPKIFSKGQTAWKSISWFPTQWFRSPLRAALQGKGDANAADPSSPPLPCWSLPRQGLRPSHTAGQPSGSWNTSCEALQPLTHGWVQAGRVRK